MVQRRLGWAFLTAAFHVVGCGVDASEIESGQDDVTHGASPALRVDSGKAAIVAQGLPASAPDGTVAILTTALSAAGTTFTFELRGMEEWRQLPLVVEAPDGKLVVQQEEIDAARAELSAKPFQPFTPAAVDARGIASSNGYAVTVEGTELRRTDPAGAVVSASLSAELEELDAIDACTYAARLVEAYVSAERNLFYARIDYAAAGCPGGHAIWALPLAN